MCVSTRNKAKQQHLDKAFQTILGTTYDRMVQFMTCTALIEAYKLEHFAWTNTGSTNILQKFTLDSRQKLTLRNLRLYCERQNLAAENLGIVDQPYGGQNCERLVIG